MRYVLISAAALVLSLGGCSNAASDPARAEAASTPSATAAQAQGNWIVDKAESKIEFLGVQKGKSFTGKFTDYDALINFDPDDLASSYVKVVIDMSSAEAGDEERNESLPGKDWFNVKTFPQAVFESSEFTLISGSDYTAQGTLTIRDKSLPVTLPFTLTISGDIAEMTSEGLTLDRTDYGVGQGVWSKGEWVDKNVAVNIRVVANRAQ